MPLAPSTPLTPGQAIAKRAVDVVIGSALLLACLPVIALLALAVAVELRTTPLFVHRRVGQHGRAIAFPKLRTLPPATPRYALKDGTTFQLSPLRRTLRRTHLDELPQLLLVVTGRLSLVGPRPRMPESHEPVDPGYTAMREVVPQGCTGLWQISAHQHLLPGAHPEYDAAYVASPSLLVDAWILLRTAGVITGLAPRVRLDDLPAWVAGRLGLAGQGAAVHGATVRTAPSSTHPLEPTRMEAA